MIYSWLAFTNLIYYIMLTSCCQGGRVKKILIPAAIRNIGSSMIISIMQSAECLGVNRLFSFSANE